VIGAGKKSGNGAPAVDFTAPKPTRREGAIGTTRERDAPDKLAKEDFLVGVEGLRNGQGRARSDTVQKASEAELARLADSAELTGGSSRRVAAIRGSETSNRASRRAETHVDNQREKLVNLSLEGERLGFLRHGVWWGCRRGGVYRVLFKVSTSEDLQ
jgi:hypothetical protein